MYIIGYWHVGRYVSNPFSNYVLYVDDGTFKMEKSRIEPVGGEVAGCKRELGRRYFGDERFLFGVDSDYVTRIILEFKGKSEDEVIEIAKSYIDKREEHRTKRWEDLQKWDRLREKFDGLVLGIEKKVDVYETGFSVRVLFNSKMSFNDRRSFIKENKCEFIKWIIKEMSETKAVIMRIGDIKFYKPVEIINLRSNEVEVKFEVKREVA